MTKSEVKEIIKRYGYTMISKSWYTGDDKTSVIFNAYDDLGNCSHFYIDFQRNYASRHSFSIILIHDAYEITDWFFD